MTTFEENIKNILQKTLKARQERDIIFLSTLLSSKNMATFEENIKNILQKPLKIVYCKLAARTPGVIRASPTPLSTICA